MRMMIPEGTLVRVKTTNGGEIVAPLAQNYRNTYDAVLKVGNGEVVISMMRIASVQEEYQFIDRDVLLIANGEWAEVIGDDALGILVSGNGPTKSVRII